MTESQTTNEEIAELIIKRIKEILHYDEGLDDICCWGPAEVEIERILNEKVDT